MAKTMRAAVRKVRANTDATLRRLLSAVVLGTALALIVIKLWGTTPSRNTFPCGTEQT
jgi:hypothetical protein